MNVLSRTGTPFCGLRSLKSTGLARSATLPVSLQVAMPIPTTVAGVGRNGTSRAASVSGFQTLLLG